MSLEEVKKMIDRALVDEAFYDLLMKNPDQTFKGYDISDPEKTMLIGLAKSPYTLAKKGLADTQKLVVAAIEYRPGSPTPGKASAK